MKKYLSCLSSVIVCFLSGGLLSAQEADLNKKLGMYVFPAKDQTADKQKEDEKACYDWAVKNSGVDPFNMQVVQPQETPKGPGGGQAVVGAAKGAAAGAAIGAIAGDAGEGAAIGAVAGGLAGNRRRKAAQQQQEQQAQQNANAANQAQIDSFKKAYTACLTGKGYTVQ